MQSPDELTVSEFEQAENGLSVVLTNAIEDAREIVDHLTKRHDERHQYWRGWIDDRDFINAALVEDEVREAAEMQFRAMRVLGLLEATREREAGKVT